MVDTIGQLYRISVNMCPVVVNLATDASEWHDPARDPLAVVAAKTLPVTAP